MGEKICTKCHYIGAPRKVKRGSGGLEAFLWTLFPLGVPYTLWRMLSKIQSCRHCGGRVMSVNSAEGRGLVAIAEAELGLERVRPVAVVTPVVQESFPPREERVKGKAPDPDQW